jgi:hypothetical protein
MAEDKRKFNGGNKNAGRKSKAEEEKANVIMLNALKELYSEDNDEDAKIRFIKETLLSSQRGQLFIAEHIFGKAPQEIKQTNFNIEAKDLDDEEIKRIKDALDNAY